MPPFDDDNRDAPDLEAPPVDPLTAWPAFAARVRARLEAGRLVYGDRSFDRPPGELLTELQCEALDLAGWGFVLFERLQRAHAAARAAARAPYDWEAMFHGAARRVDELRAQLATQSRLRVAAEQRAGNRNVAALEARIRELEGSCPS